MFDEDQSWICEGCGAVAEGVNPPDKCTMCDHEYFENLGDLLREKQGKTLH